MKNEKEFNASDYAEENAVEFIQWCAKEKLLLIKSLSKKEAKSLYLQFLANKFAKILQYGTKK